MSDSDQDDDPPDLVVPQASCLVDPVLADVVEKGYGIAACANPTHDPDRMTLHVPSEHTVLSLGAPSPAANWNTDIGITGYSDRHIHFEVKKNAELKDACGPATVHKTIVSLGTSATTTAIHGHDPKVPSEFEGYAMVTDALAWHQSTGQHYILSQEGDVSLRSHGPLKRAVVQAELGHVDLNGGEEVTLSSTAVGIGASKPIEWQDTHYEQPWLGQTPTVTFTDRVSTGVDCVSAVNALFDLVMTVIAKAKTIKASGLRKMAREEYEWSDALSFIGDAINFGIAAKKLISTFTTVPTPKGGPPTDPGCVKLSAQMGISGLAHEVGLFGRRSATMGGVVAGSVTAGLMATLKSALFCSVGGMLTSLKAAKKVEVVAYEGNVVVGAKKNVEFTSNDELVGGSDDLVQVTSEGSILMGGRKGTWVGGKQWGVRMSDDGIAFGKASGTEDMKSAKIEPYPAVRIDKGKIEIACGDSGCITLSDDLALFESPAVDIQAKSKNVSFAAAGMIKAD